MGKEDLGVEFRWCKPIIRMGNLPQICDEGKLETRSRKPKDPSPKPPLAGEVTTEPA